MLHTHRFLLHSPSTFSLPFLFLLSWPWHLEHVCTCSSAADVKMSQTQSLYGALFRRSANLILMAFITGNSILEPLPEGLLAQIHIDLNWRVFGRNRTGDLRITQLGEVPRSSRLSYGDGCITKDPSGPLVQMSRKYLSFEATFRSDKHINLDTGHVYILSLESWSERLWGVGSKPFLSKKKPARAGWPRRLVLIQATPRAEVDVIGVQKC